MTDSPLIPEHTALLLMDFQHSVLGALPAPERVLEAAQRAQRAAQAAGIREIHVRVALSPEDRAAVPAHNKAFAPIAQAGALAAAEPENEVHPALRTTRTDQKALTVTKTRVSAFSSPSLAPLLREQDIDTLVLGGVFTTGFILSTVRDAADRDYRILVLSDVCADPDQQLHDTLMWSLLPTQADVIDVAAFEAAARTA